MKLVSDFANHLLRVSVLIHMTVNVLNIGIWFLGLLLK